MHEYLKYVCNTFNACVQTALFKRNINERIAYGQKPSKSLQYYNSIRVWNPALQDIVNESYGTWHNLSQYKGIFLILQFIGYTNIDISSNRNISNNTISTKSNSYNVTTHPWLNIVYR